MFSADVRGWPSPDIRDMLMVQAVFKEKESSAKCIEVEDNDFQKGRVMEQGGGSGERGHWKKWRSGNT